MAINESEAVLPQVSLADAYVLPFSKRRKRTFDSSTEEVKEEYVPLERKVKTTGMGFVDLVLKSFAARQFNTRRMADQLGVKPNELRHMFNLSTNADYEVFRRNYIIRTADDLLRYTKMPVKEIARLVGYRDQYSLNRLYESAGIDTPPSYRRHRLRKSGDLGRYQL